jgi:hypothetical protein
VEAVAFHGDSQVYRVRLDSGTELRVATSVGNGAVQPGERAFLSWPSDAPVVLTR